MWKSILIAVIPSILTLIIGWLGAKYRFIKNEKEEQEKLQEVYHQSVKYMLRKCLKDDYEYYTRQGYCSLEDKADVEECYRLYHGALGGNGLGTRYYESIMSLPEAKNE